MPERIPIIRRKLIKWFEKHGRDYPWRHTGNPYKIMIAEFMLHRTKADQVLPVYVKFINKFPDIQSLSKAKPEEIRKYVAALGLNWRYRHFIEAANYIIEKFSGIYPADLELLKKIPGIGDYVASAIRILAFKKPSPAVDSNVARLINRFFNLQLIGEIRRKKDVINYSKLLFSTKRCDRLLFAIIDFTSLICKPKNPECIKCFIKSYCGFYYDSKC